MNLNDLGFGPFFERQLDASRASDVTVARVAAEHRGGYELSSCSGSGAAKLSGRARRALDPMDFPAVGDWVVVDAAPEPDRTVVIERVLARRSVFTRGAAGREARRQVVAANVDQVFAVCGLDDDFNVRRIERYLARIWASGARPAVILTKADVCAEVALRVALVDEMRSAAPSEATSSGAVEVFVTSVPRSEGLDAVRASIARGMTVAFVGSSGAGKSTLVNALVGREAMATGDVRTRDQRGCHTTTHRRLVMVPTGGILIDTPGMRELALVDEEGLDAVFADIVALAAACRYRDCRHDTEPGCAVRVAVESGRLGAERLEHYRKLEREALAYELRSDARKRRQTERAWGRLSREAERARRRKEA